MSPKPQDFFVGVTDFFSVLLLRVVLGDPARVRRNGADRIAREEVL